MRNSGELPAANVRLQVGRDGLAEIEWDDGKKETILFQTEIQLGAMPIEKSVRLSIWTTESFGENDSFLVIHDTGKETLYLASGEIESATRQFLSVLTAAMSIISSILFAFALTMLYTTGRARNRFIAAQNIQLSKEVSRSPEAD
ncbi:hypothetical protein [Novipirellula caenicola]|uniref:hypothetical protein n=1 Tax=Novipirellula caenicola TaxID=1536901 RepID=UPI0031EC2E49